MFKLIGKNQNDRKIPNFDYIRYRPSKISTINTANSQKFIKILRDDSVITLLKSNIELNFDVLHAAIGNR